jgi:hypothetical protein
MLSSLLTGTPLEKKRTPKALTCKGFVARLLL